MESDNERRPADPPPDSADLWLKRHTEPPPETARRIARQALRGGRKPGLVSRPLVLAAASVALLLVVAMFLLNRLDEPRATGLVELRHPSPSVPTITNVSGPLELRLPTTEADPRIARESTTPLIFNEARVAAAIVPGGDPTFLITGGEL